MDMKRTVALVLTALMLLAMTACAVQGVDVLAEPEAGTAEEPPDVPAEEPAEEPEPTEEPEAAEPTPEPTEEPEATEEPVADLEEVLGAVEGHSYVNEYFDIAFDPGEDWQFFSRDDLADMKDMAGDMLKDYSESYGELFTQLLDNATVHYVMAAASPDGAQNVVAVVEDLDSLSALASDGALLEQFTEGLDLDAGQLEELGLTAEFNTVSLAGVDRSGVKLTLDNDLLALDEPICQQIVVLLADGYAMQVAMTSLNGEGAIDAMAEAFSPAS